jgi:hypothetical protein
MGGLASTLAAGMGVNRDVLRTDGRPAAHWFRLEAGRSDDLGNVAT